MEQSETSKAASLMGKRAAAVNLKKGKQYFSDLGKKSAEKRKLVKKQLQEST